MTKQDTIFFVVSGAWAIIPMRRYYCVTLCVNGDYRAVNLAVPVFALPVDVAVRGGNFAFAELNHVSVSKFQIPFDSVNTHRRCVDLVEIIQQYLGIAS